MPSTRLLRLSFVLTILYAVLILLGYYLPRKGQFHGRFQRIRTHTDEIHLFQNDESEQINAYKTSIPFGKYSQINLIEGQGPFLVTQTVHVIITLRNGLNEVMQSGGDVVFLSAISRQSCVSGHVIDFGNGSYLGQVKLFWPGQITIRALIASTRTKFAMFQEHIKLYGVTRYKLGLAISAMFNNSQDLEATPCHPSPYIPGENDLCNMTQKNGGLSWYCAVPWTKGLSCEHLQAYRAEQYNLQATKTEKLIRKAEYQSIEPNIKILVQKGEINWEESSLTCSSDWAKEATWTTKRPTGFQHNGVWQNILCQSNIGMSIEEYKQCFRGKHLFLLGDSSLRLWFKYFMRQLNMTLITEEWSVFAWHKESEAFDKENDFRVTWAPHGMPFIHKDSWQEFETFKSIPSYLKKIMQDEFGSSDTVIVIGIGSHFHGYSGDVFRDRARRIAAAVEALLRKIPQAKVFIKGLHPFNDLVGRFDVRFSMIFEGILMEEFAGLAKRVAYLNQWDIGLSHFNKGIHPTGSVHTNMIHQFMIYLC